MELILLADPQLYIAPFALLLSLPLGVKVLQEL